MHVFLTGPVQIGKSTLIAAALDALQPERLGGFRTVSAKPEADGSRPVYLHPAAAQDLLCGAQNRVGIRRPELGIASFPDAFETAGMDALKGAEDCDLVLMDEIGRMERHADTYSARIRTLLDGCVPILGVVQKKADTPLAAAIRSHPNVRLIEVSEENRDVLLPEILSALRLLNHVSLETDIRLISIAGGTKNNVISSECKAEILVAKEDADKVKASVAELKATWDKEFLGKEPGLTVDVEEESVSGVAVMNAESTKRVITYFIICPNGVQCYDRELEGLVETSLNLGIVETTKDTVKLESLVRSSMESKKADMKEILDTCAQVVGASGKVQGGYPAWEYKVDSELRKVMVETFVEQYGKEPVVSTIHVNN